MTTVEPAGVSASLAESDVFGGLSDKLRNEVAAAAHQRFLAAGSWLFRQGDPAHSLFMVGSGCLEIVVESPAPARVVGALFRGGVIGELALLSGRPRSASARARRDSVVLELTRDRFDELLEADPAFTAALLEILGDKLSQTGTLAAMPSSRPRVWSAKAGGRTSHAQLAALRHALVQAASPYARVATLADPGSGDTHRAEVLDRAEASNDVVLLVTDEPTGDWSDFAWRQADRRLLVVDPQCQAETSIDDALATDLIFLGSRSDTTMAAWEAACAPVSRHLVPDGDGDVDAVRRLARRLLGRAIGLVLSGGGARGLAHIGVLQALADADCDVDRIGGTSMGAFVAAMHAMKMSTDDMVQVCRRELVQRKPFRDLTVPRSALVKGQAAREMLSRVFADQRIESLPLDYFCISSDLVAAEVVVHRSGPVADAAMASMTIPGWMPPIASGKRLLVDGGLLDNLPIDVMAGTGEGPVIAVDVMGRFTTGRDGSLPKLIDTLARATTLGSWRWLAASREQAELVITPTLAGVGLTDFTQLDHVVALGREAAAEQLRQHVGAVSARRSDS